MKRLVIASIIGIMVSVLGYRDSVRAEWIEGGNPLPQDFSHMVVFDSAGTFTWTVPEGVYKIKVELWGGGGGGVTVDLGYDGDMICYGGAGGYGLAYIDVTPGMTCAITVGNYGGYNGGDGGNTIVVCGSQSYTATGGEGAQYRSGYYNDYCEAGIGGTSDAPFSLEGGAGTWAYMPNSDTVFGDRLGGNAPRGGHGYINIGGYSDDYYAAQPGGGGLRGAPGMVIIWY